MKTNKTSARGIPLAVLFIALAMAVIPATAAETPSLFVQQFLDPEQIYVAGTEGAPGVATLTLVLEGLGPMDRVPIDCMLVIDVSATSELSEAKRFALDLIERFSPEDRIGLVAFGTTAWLEVPMTSDRTRLKTAIADLTMGGKSAFGDALQLTRQELMTHGRGDAIVAEVLLTDGQSNIGRDPYAEGEAAGATGFKIISVGIGTLINRSLLETLASETQGLFFARPTSSTNEKIEALLFVETAAQTIRVEKVLPPEILYVEASPSPRWVEENPDGTTSLVWNIGNLSLGGQWLTQISLKAAEKGVWLTDQGSSVQFKDFRGVETQIPITALQLAAVEPNWPPEAVFSYNPTAPRTIDVVTFTDQSTDADGQIAKWLWIFGDGEQSREQNPEHRFSNSGTYTVTLLVVDELGAESEPITTDLVVLNSEPMALFTCEPKEPRVGAETLLDAGGSADSDGQIASYAWDLDEDGLFETESTSPQVTHTFKRAGKINVSLKVTDDEGESTLIEKPLIVLASVIATRVIGTCLPDDETIANGIITVTVSITANTVVHGLTLHETTPVGWVFTPIDNGRATFREETTDWLFLETLVEGDVHVISYTLTAQCTPLSTDMDPISNQEVEVGRARATINGTVGSSSPRLSQMVLGEDKITRVATLSVPVVISRWGTEQGAIDLCLPDEIAFDQIQYAVALWLSGDSVPHTGGQMIDRGMIQDLIAYWLTDTSVHNPLP